MESQEYISQIIWVIITMLFSAFFAGMEIAFVSSNRMLAEMDRDKNTLSQKILSVFYRQPNDFVSTMLVGNNIAFVIYGILIAKLFDSTIFHGMDASITVPLDTIISTVIVLFTVEFMPKSFFKSNPNQLLTIFSAPAYIFYIILWPISKSCTYLSRIFLRLIGIKITKQSEGEEFSKIDLDHLINYSIDNAKNNGEIDDEVKIFQNALDFPDTKVRDCMIPRIEITAVNIENCTLNDLKQKFIETGHSKIIVYKNDIDHIVGYIHSSEMFRNPSDWRKNIRTMPFVPETMAAQKLLQSLLQEKKSLGVVIDEFGGTSGIVSLEDIVEEIFGEIEDEHDNSKYIAKRLDTGEYILSARLEIDKVNEMFNIELPESDEYMTIGGLILHYYQSFPKLNEIVTIGNFEFKIINKTMTKVELVKLKVKV